MEKLKKVKSKQSTDDVLSDTEGVSSVNECTGLVSAGDITCDEYENCMGLLKFSPKNIAEKSKNDK